MSKSFAMKAALGMVALVGAMVAMQGEAQARFNLFGGHHRGGCGCAAEEASCGCAAAVEPSCCAEVVKEEPSCAAEPSCCAPEPSCGCSSGRKFKLFGRFRKHGGCGCSAPADCGCGAPAECGCGAPAEPACGAPADSAPAPPAPEASTTHWWVPARA